MLGRKNKQPLPPVLDPQACGPTVHQTCKENTYVNGFCFLFGSNLLQQPQKFPEVLRGRLPLVVSTYRQHETRGLGQDWAGYYSWSGR